MSRDYKPYEEWWQDEVLSKEFERDIVFRVQSFHQNMVNVLQVKERTRQEWMEMFLLWLEFESES